MKPDTCKHFTGVQHDRCESGIRYQEVRDSSGPGAYRWPCLPPHTPGTTCQPTCTAREYLTQAEVSAFDTQVEAAVTAALSALADGKCPHCGNPIESKQQVGPCVYARPCGHRIRQGTAA